MANIRDLATRQVPDADWQGSGWGPDLGGRERRKEVLEERRQRACVWFGEGNMP